MQFMIVQKIEHIISMRKTLNDETKGRNDNESERENVKSQSRSYKMQFAFQTSLSVYSLYEKDETR